MPEVTGLVRDDFPSMPTVLSQSQRNDRIYPNVQPSMQILREFQQDTLIIKRLSKI